MNPYIEAVDADDYFGERLNSALWFDTTEEDKTAALKTATRYIDRLTFVGAQTDATQEHQFPRGGDTDVPLDIQYACCEIAFELLDGVEIAKEIENLDMVSQGYGNAKSTYDRTTKPAHILAGIPSIVAWHYLLPYLPDLRIVQVTRV